MQGKEDEFLAQCQKTLKGFEVLLPKPFINYVYDYATA